MKKLKHGNRETVLDSALELFRDYYILVCFFKSSVNVDKYDMWRFIKRDTSLKGAALCMALYYGIMLDLLSYENCFLFAIKINK